MTERPTARDLLDPPPKKGGKTLLIAGLTLIALAVLGAALGLGLWRRDMVRRLDRAAQALETERYAAAKSALVPVPETFFPRAREMNLLAEAGILAESGQTEEALARAEALGDCLSAPRLVSQLMAKQSEEARNEALRSLEALLAEGKTKKAAEQLEAECAALAAEPANALRYAAADRMQSMGYAAEAAEVFHALGDYEDAPDRAVSAALTAAEAMAEDASPAELADALCPYADDPRAQRLLESLRPRWIEGARRYMSRGEEEKAMACLTLCRGEEAGLLSRILQAKSVFEILDTLEDPAGEKRIHSEDFLAEFLRGAWSDDGGHRLVFDGMVTFCDLPIPPGTDDGPWAWEDGLLALPDTESGEPVPALKIHVTGRDTLSCYVYAQKKTVKMKRKPE